MPAGPLPVRPFTSTLRERRAHHDIPDSFFLKGANDGRRPAGAWHVHPAASREVRRVLSDPAGTMPDDERRGRRAHDDGRCTSDEGDGRSRASPTCSGRPGRIMVLFEGVRSERGSFTCAPRRGSMASVREPERNHTGLCPNHVRNSVCLPGRIHRANTTCASAETRSDFASFIYGESDHPDPRWLLLREVLDHDGKQEYVQWSQGAIALDAPPQLSPVPESEG
jgi:hypothetical protein